MSWRPASIAEQLEGDLGTSVAFNGWIVSLRDHGGIVFFDVEDRDRQVQCVLDQAVLETFNLDRALRPEMAVRVAGTLAGDPADPEIHCTNVELMGEAEEDGPQMVFRASNALSSVSTDTHLRNRHMHMRSPEVRAAMLIRHEYLGFFHDWFRQRSFVEFSAPVLTPLPLYDDHTAIDLDVHGETIYLTQCVGFYLEAAIYGLDRVYNFGPSFRAEEGRSKRHLIEYWHIKAELAHTTRDDLMRLVEDLVFDAVEFAQELAPLIEQAGGEGCARLATKRFPKIAYRDAIELLQRRSDEPVKFGSSLSSAHESAISNDFEGPFWIVGLPRAVEPFPYVVDSDDEELTMTADLIAPNGYGELLGIAEKTHSLSELDDRMAEKGRLGDERYEWIRDLRRVGSVPHGGVGMGFERFLRWVVGTEHVRDFAGFPRAFGRRIRP